MILRSIHEHHLCALNTETLGDSCRGDSGGPLMYRDPQSMLYYVIGVVSGSKKSCSEGFPGFYTKTSDFRQFIRTHAPDACFKTAS